MIRNSIRRRAFLWQTAGGCALAALPRAGLAATSRAGWFNVRDYGAEPGGAALSTKAIQKAIDACHTAGGGTVVFPPGRYLSGTLFLKSNVTLHLETAAVLLGSKELRDYPVTVPALRSYTDNYTDKSLLYGEKVENVAIEGRGTIDGQGAAFRGPYKVRPYLLRIIECRNVAVSDITLRDSPMWVQHYLGCLEVRLRGLRVHSRVNANNDGINIDSCERVTISDCQISSGDDAIVLKSTTARPCRNVAIANCVLSTDCNALKLGTESNGGFENIAISNCAVHDTRLAGLALEIVDGGTLDRVSATNLVMDRVGGPIFLRLGDRARPFVEGGARPPVGRFRNVQISHVQAVATDRIGCAIAGLPDHPIENVTLEDIRLLMPGGAKLADAARPVPEHPDKYPEYKMFGMLPAYGFYCRHVRGIRFRHVELRTAQPDERPPLVFEDAEGVDLDPASGPAQGLRK